MNIKKFKRLIGLRINNSQIRPIFDRLNLIVFHWNDRMRWIRRDRNLEKTYYVIRPQTNSQGLLSTYMYVLKNVLWATKQGYLSYVDFESSNCQYYTGRTIEGTQNAWEYYFEQPCHIQKSDLEKGNVLSAGWSFRGREKPSPLVRKPEIFTDPELKSFAWLHCPVRPYILDIVQEKYSKLFHGQVLGVFIRGTDYVKLKPKGHPKQPDIAQVIEKIEEFLKLYSIDQIFVVTEDDSYYHTLKSRFKDKVFSSDDYFIKDYKAGTYVESAFTNDAYERGLNYLIRILLFGKCAYTIAGITNGSLVATLLRNEPTQSEYWFDLGLY